MIRYIYAILLILSFLACKREASLPPQPLLSKPQEEKMVDTSVTDTDTVYPETDEKFEYRLTRNDGTYQYAYVVEGEDEAGTKVSGAVQVAGKYGVGKLTHPQLGSIRVKTEWIGKGTLMAIDTLGNAYKLSVK